jgi:RNA polymerase sigma factor for flagellar operon FliA
MTREQLLLSELALIERVIGWVCARHGLRGADAEDFASIVKLRLIENDYAVLGRFEGRSALKTYLVAVVNHLYLDHRRQRCGKWRPSAEARRLGPLAVRLEVLLRRDGLGFDEACGVLGACAPGGPTRDALQRIADRLPQRSPRPVDASSDVDPPAPGPGTSGPVEQAERQILAGKTFAALRAALAKLEPRDRILLRMNVEGGLSIADVARFLGEDQKGLYRRRDALFKSLRLSLEADGIRRIDVEELLSTLDWEAALCGEPGGEGVVVRPTQADRPAGPQEGVS